MSKWRPKLTPIPFWTAMAPCQSIVHFWYYDGEFCRMCDGEAWPAGEPLVSADADVRPGCEACLATYVYDIVHGEGRSMRVDEAQECYPTRLSPSVLICASASVAASRPDVQAPHHVQAATLAGGL